MQRKLLEVSALGTFIMPALLALRLVAPASCEVASGVDHIRGGDPDCTAFVQYTPCVDKSCSEYPCTKWREATYISDDGSVTFNWKGYECDDDQYNLISNGSSYPNDCQTAGFYPKTKSGCASSSSTFDCGSTILCLAGQDPLPDNYDDAVSQVSGCVKNSNGVMSCDTTDDEEGPYPVTQLPPASDDKCNKLPAE